MIIKIKIIIIMTIMIKKIMAGHHKMRTVTNLLIFNLSLTDLINTVFNSTFSYIFMKNRWEFFNAQSMRYRNAPRNWIFGVLFCRLTAFMTHLSIVASVLTMAAIAGERL